MSSNKKPKEKNISTVGFFKYFESLLGYHIYIFLVFNIFVGLLDGLGLAMFIPLLGLATGTNTGTDSLGNLSFIPEFFESFGMTMDLVSVLIIMVVLFSSKAILSYLKDLYFIKLRLISISKVRYKLIRGLNSLSYEGYTKSDPGQIQYAMVGETARLITAMTHFIRAMQSVVILFTYLGLAFFSNWKFAILVSIGGLLSNFIYKIINSKTKSEAKRLSMQGNVFNSYLIQAIQNFKYLKATNNFSKYNNNLRNSIDDFEETNFRIGNLNAIAASLREPVIIIVIAVVLVVQVKLIGGSFGGVLVSLLLFYRALTFLVSMQNYWNAFLSNSAALDALTDLLEKMNLNSEPNQLLEKSSKIKTIELEDVRLKFDNTQLINSISLEIQQGKTIAFIGESGAGKSTLANLIGGLYKPTEGVIKVNGKPLLLEELNTYRSRIGYIAQDPVIFDDTLFNNVTFWDNKSEENLKKFEHCINLVHLTEFLKNIDGSEDAELGNDGVLISGGQKQRISIARELYRDVDILIMDEATSALDSETEKIIKENIDNLHGEYIMIIIAHRLSTIKNADIIYLMSNGVIVDSGPYDQLYKKSEVFKRMVNLQVV